jgi:tRNA-2-methylthio-N6-dimethylallyladenosine synthase
MNERDSEAVEGLLLDRGFEKVQSPEGADLVLYNTCSIRDHAEQKVFGRMGSFRKMKEKNPELIVGIMGCMAQEHGENFFKKNPEIDLVCGPGNLSQIPDLVQEIRQKRTPRLAIDKLDDEYGLEGIFHRVGSIKANVTIMKGCDHRCTYCIVPYTRGKEVSRHSESILREIKDLEVRGFKDVMLLGQNVNSYGKGLEEEIDFAGLLKKIQNASPKIDRLRFITSHPKDAHTRLFTAMRDLPMVCEHLHLPVQSGSDRILKRMKREHTAAWYAEQIEEYRSFVPGGSLTTDFIVGFPGETEEDFLETLALAERTRFDSAYIFSYSPRPGTPALKLEDDVPEEEKSRRLQALMAAQRAVSLKINQGLIGRSFEVLFEDRSRRGENRFYGRTRTFKRVVVSSQEDLTGKIRKARITGAADETLLGELE